MSGLSVQDQESKAVPCYHDRPPQYYSRQPSQDLLTSVIEIEQTRRILKQWLEDVDKEVENLL
jgi:hypothetical protein